MCDEDSSFEKDLFLVSKTPISVLKHKHFALEKFQEEKSNTNIYK